MTASKTIPGELAEFNRMTVVAAAEVASEFKSHNEMELLEVQWGIVDRCASSSKSGRAANWAKAALEESDSGFPSPYREKVMTEYGLTSLARAMVEVAILCPSRLHQLPCWKKFIAGLRFDGFELVEKEAEPNGEFLGFQSQTKLGLSRMLPNEVPDLDFREAESEVVSLLKRSGFMIAMGHLKQAISAFQRGEWSSANGELRNFYESYLNEIAISLGYIGKGDGKAKRDFLGSVVRPPFLFEEYNEWNTNIQKPQYVQGLMSRMHPHGGHPGLSEEEDATFRLQITLVTARLFLRRYVRRSLS